MEILNLVRPLGERPDIGALHLILILILIPVPVPVRVDIAFPVRVRDVDSAHLLTNYWHRRIGLYIGDAV